MKPEVNMKQPKAKSRQVVIRAWEQSGLSQKDFCSAQKIALSTFQYWKRRIEGAGEEPRFVRVAASAKPRYAARKSRDVSENPRDAAGSPQREILVSFESGIRLSIPGTIPCEILSRVILAVNEALCTSI